MAKVIVVGSGVSGLLSACYAAAQGHEVKVLTYGSGALTVAGGIIDVFGYDEKGNLVKDPIEHIKTLKAPHPYALIGAENVNKSLEAFKDLTASQNYRYVGDGHCNQAVPTAIGSFKPSCLIPPSISSDALFDAKKLLVVGFDLLKDYYPHLIAKNLRQHFTNSDGQCSKEIDVKMVSLGWQSGREYRDVSALDIARALETSAGRANLINQLKGAVDYSTAVIIPPVLGEQPQLSWAIQNEIESTLKTKLVEVSSIPPSVTGLRLDKLLVQAAEKFGVEIIEKVKVIGYQAQSQEAGKAAICHSVITGGTFGHEQEFSADAFIIATGGVFGGGLIAQMGRLFEPIFNLDSDVPEDQKDWSHQYLFTGKPQPFAAYGVSVNEHLQPVNKEGQCLFANVFFVGRSLQGYDFCYEKSGNGVCVASAYHASNEMHKLLPRIEELKQSLSGPILRGGYNEICSDDEQGGTCCNCKCGKSEVEEKSE